MGEEECRRTLRTWGRELHKKPDGNYYILDPLKPGLWRWGHGYSLEEVEKWITIYARGESTGAAKPSAI